jgi:hypothetical protein
MVSRSPCEVAQEGPVVAVAELVMNPSPWISCFSSWRAACLGPIPSTQPVMDLDSSILVCFICIRKEEK